MTGDYRLSLRDWSVADLTEEAQALGGYLGGECFGAGDVRRYAAVCGELNRRGYEVQEAVKVHVQVRKSE